MVRTSALGYVILLSLNACASPASEDPGPELPPPPPPIEHPEVPADLEPVAYESRCIGLTDGESVLGTSSEGDLWLQHDGELRVATPDGARVPLGHRRLERLSAATPYDGEEAVVVADRELWRVRGHELEPLYLPDGLGVPWLVCGDAARDGAWLATSQGLLERSSGEWWWVQPPEMEFEGVDKLYAVEGACTGPNGILWFRTREGTHWRLDPTGLLPLDPPQHATLGAADRDGLTLAATDAILRTSDGLAWDIHRFAAGDVRGVGASGGRVWVAAGEDLYCATPEGEDLTWARTDVTLPATLDGVHAHAAGGAWVIGEGMACHVAPAAPIRVRGLRPSARLRPGSADLQVLEIPEAEALRVFRDDEALDAESWFLRDVALGDAGWHELRFEVDVAGQTLARTLPYRVVPGDVSWEADIAPLYEAHCASSECHDSGNGRTLDLDTFEAWNTYAFEIRAAVTSGRMPRTRSEGWSATEQQKILDWIEGGMLP